MIDHTTLSAPDFLIYRAGFKTFHPNTPYGCCHENPYLSDSTRQHEAHTWWMGFADARAKHRQNLQTTFASNLLNHL
jgi:hypothetical protein